MAYNEVMSKPKVDKGLTAKQEAFAQAVADGMTQSDAYRKVYETKTKSEKSVNETASQLMANLKVASRVAELKAKLVAVSEAKELWRREDSVLFYRGIVRSEEEKAQDRIKACERLDKMHGYDAPTKVEHSGGVGVQVVAVADMSAVLGEIVSDE